MVPHRPLQTLSFALSKMGSHWEFLIRGMYAISYALEITLAAEQTIYEIGTKWNREMIQEALTIVQPGDDGDVHYDGEKCHTLNIFQARVE